VFTVSVMSPLMSMAVRRRSGVAFIAGTGQWGTAVSGACIIELQALSSILRGIMAQRLESHTNRPWKRPIDTRPFIVVACADSPHRRRHDGEAPT